MRVVIAIPCYRENMDLEERASLVQCSRVFGSKYDVVFFAPADLECSAYLEIVPHGRVERFDNSFFTSVSSYSRLLLTPEFYLRFSDYDYMLNTLLTRLEKSTILLSNSYPSRSFATIDILFTPLRMEYVF